METESGAKIAIRGKGSVKEGKGRSDAAHSSNQEEDLHCLVMADTEDKINKAKQLIHNVIETVRLLIAPDFFFYNFANHLQAASTPENQNELKRNQLRELAALNGTLRDDENQACQNCGKIGHRKYDCPEKQNYTASIICRVCGNAGHMARDCPDRQRGASWRNDGPRPAGRVGGGDGIDREYEVCKHWICHLAQTLTHGSNSCKNSAVALVHLPVSRLVLAVAKRPMPDLGRRDRLGVLHPGDLVVMTETRAMVPLAALLLGLAIVTVAMITRATATTVVVDAEAPVRPPGNSSSSKHMANRLKDTEGTPATPATVAITRPPAWVPPVRLRVPDSMRLLVSQV